MSNKMLSALIYPLQRHGKLPRVQGIAGVRVFLATICLAILLRFVLASTLNDFVQAADPRHYRLLAQNVIDGYGLLTRTSLYGGEVRAMFPPLYPLILAGAAWLGGMNNLTITLLNTVLELGGALVLILMGRDLRHRRAGLLAAAAYLLWPSLILTAPVAQKESLTTLLVLVLVWQFARLGTGHPASWTAAMGVGASAALLGLTQPSLATLVGLLGIVFIRRMGFRHLLLFGLKASLVFVLVMAPWWIRNWMLFGTFVPLTTSGGLSLLVVMKGGHFMLSPATFALDEVARSTASAQEALHWIRQHPGDYLRKVAEAAIRSTFSDTAASWLMGIRDKPVFWAQRLLLLTCYALALWAMVKRRLPTLTLILVAVGLQMLLVQIWFEYSERHRVHLVPLALLAAASLVRKAS